MRFPVYYTVVDFDRTVQSIIILFQVTARAKISTATIPDEVKYPYVTVNNCYTVHGVTKRLSTHVRICLRVEFCFNVDERVKC